MNPFHSANETRTHASLLCSVILVNDGLSKLPLFSPIDWFLMLKNPNLEHPSLRKTAQLVLFYIGNTSSDLTETYVFLATQLAGDCLLFYITQHYTFSLARHTSQALCDFPSPAARREENAAE